MATTPERLLQLDDVELAFSRGTTKDRRKYLTLIEETGTSRRGGLGETSRVRTMTGERLACKKLLMPDREAFGSADAYEAELQHRERAFREEYDTLCRLSSFKGFVKARAYGYLGDMPLILMEWVEGVSVGNASLLLKRNPDDPGANPLAVAQIGRDVFHLLARLEAETELFVHRDLSASNIMIRTSDRSLQDQVSDGYYDICFIDFGSAATLRAGDGAFTTDTRILRGATPGYAPPEMLSNDLPGLEELRRSTKIDVYAASSVLYEMLCGHLPFDVAKRTGAGSDYLFKMTNDPVPTGFAEGSAEQLLADIVMRGICATQDARCSSYAMYKMLEFYVEHFDENTGRAANGKDLVALNPRSIDSPDFRFEQIALSNPLASSARKTVAASRADSAETVALNSGKVRADFAETVAMNTGEMRADAVETVAMNTGAVRAASAETVAMAPGSVRPAAPRGNSVPAAGVRGAVAGAAGGVGASGHQAWQRGPAQPTPGATPQVQVASQYATPTPQGAYAQGRGGAWANQGAPAPASSGSSLSKVAFVLAVLAVIAVMAVVVAVFFVAPNSNAGQSESSSPTASDDRATSDQSSGSILGNLMGAEAANGANAWLVGTWSGKMVSTSKGNACYGAEGYPLQLVVKEATDAGNVTCDVQVLYHAHNRTNQAGDVQSSQGDALQSWEGIVGTYDGEVFTLEIDESAQMGRDSSLIIKCKAKEDSAAIEATVTSVFAGAQTEDVYNLTKQ